MNKNYFIIGAIIVLAVLGFVFVSDESEAINLSEDYGVDSMVIYKSPTCGCCDLYSSYIRKYGAEVTVKNIENMEEIKEKYNIPSSVYSCHTTVMEGKVVEGHIPVEGIVALLENDSVSNIGMPGMPSGSPGMPGAKSSPFTIYSFDETEVNEFIKI